MSVVQEHLKALSDFYEQYYPDQPNFQKWLLENCQLFEAKPKPDEQEYGESKMCYHNALMTVQWEGERYRYCEGIAYTPGSIPMEHAWVLDTEDGKVFDVTWRDGGNECGFCLGLGTRFDDDEESETYGDEYPCNMCPNSSGKLDHEHRSLEGTEYFGIVIEDAVQRTLKRGKYGVLLNMFAEAYEQEKGVKLNVW